MLNLQDIPELQQFPWPQIATLQEGIRQKFSRADWEIPEDIFKKLFLSAIVSDQESWQEKMAAELLYALDNYPIPSPAADYVANQLWSSNATDAATGKPTRCMDAYPELDQDPYGSTPQKHKPKLLAATPQKTNHHVAPGQDIRKQPTVNPSQIPTQNPQKGKLIPIKKLQQPLSRPTFLADQWKLDSRWPKLTPCAIAVFYALLWRTYQKATFKKITQAFTQGRTWFPWCLKGIDSLSKRLLYTKKSNPIAHHYKKRQILRALKQLEDSGFISTLFRGYEGQGAGKCFVFLNPKMSAAFHRASKRHKKGYTR